MPEVIGSDICHCCWSHPIPQLLYPCSSPSLCSFSPALSLLPLPSYLPQWVLLGLLMQVRRLQPSCWHLGSVSYIHFQQPPTAHSTDQYDWVVSLFLLFHWFILLFPIDARHLRPMFWLVHSNAHNFPCSMLLIHRLWANFCLSFPNWNTFFQPYLCLLTLMCGNKVTAQ